MSIKSMTNDVLLEAANILKNGDCVAIPTETVYGLAADATNGQAVAKIFDIKGRPTFNPLISHFYNIYQLLDFIDLNETIKKLSSSFWPVQ